MFNPYTAGMAWVWECSYLGKLFSSSKFSCYKYDDRNGKPKTMWKLHYVYLLSSEMTVQDLQINKCLSSIKLSVSAKCHLIPVWIPYVYRGRYWHASMITNMEMFLISCLIISIIFSDTPVLICTANFSQF